MFHDNYNNNWVSPLDFFTCIILVFVNKGKEKKEGSHHESVHSICQVLNKISRHNFALYCSM